MAALELRFHPEADAEYAEAMVWYSKRGVNLPLAFEDDLEQTLRIIQEAPSRWATLDGIHRKLSLRRFPYTVIYRQLDAILWIVAVANDSQRPGYWRGRDL